MAQSVAAPAYSELLIKKSRFIGCVQAVPNRAAAQAIVAALRASIRGQHTCAGRGYDAGQGWVSWRT